MPAASDPPHQDADPALPAWLEPLREGARTIAAEDLTAFVPPTEPRPREGAVLVLFGDGPEGPDVLLTERAHTMRSQPGQVSFPGGSLDPGETAVEGALREAHEETGLDPDGVDVFAVLPRLWLPPRNFAVAPVLGYWHHPSPIAVTNPREVHAVFRVPIEELLDPANRFTVRHPLGWNGPGWMIGPDRDVLLWGFTAGVINALFDYVGWTRPWDRSVERPLPEQHIDWNRVARQLGIEVPAGEQFDPVAAGLIPDPYDADEPPSGTVDVDREHKP
ncbi:NUDIX hydrolase [Nocardioides caldifontis]|uniref:NUDIX hydrolase n=1 Tax=Nocardioides caldifontis TaxID=2588938 RepID=UPI001939C85A|nr:CoA pyrophosphatase [Nocardioides caldifontis]